MRAYPLRGEVGGGWALEFPIILSPVKWERADRQSRNGEWADWIYCDSFVKNQLYAMFSRYILGFQGPDSGFFVNKVESLKRLTYW